MSTTASDLPRAHSTKFDFVFEKAAGGGVWRAERSGLVVVIKMVRQGRPRGNILYRATVCDTHGRILASAAREHFVEAETEIAEKHAKLSGKRGTADSIVHELADWANAPAVDEKLDRRAQVYAKRHGLVIRARLYKSATVTHRQARVLQIMCERGAK